MEVQARRRGQQTYYYLTHSYREGNRVRKIEQYLGRSPPKNLAAAKSALSLALATTQSSPALDRIRDRFHASQRELSPRDREKQLATFAIQFTYDSNRIEGSSLTLQETSLLIDYGVTPSNRPLSDVREALAHQSVFLSALQSTKALTLDSLLEWHEQMFRETKPLLAGRIRAGRVRISGSSFEPPLPVELDLPLREFFDWYRVSWKTLHAVVLAALVHLRLASIHPFGDGNGRVTRVAMNYVLFKKGYPMIDIRYESRAGYYRALERSHITQDEGAFVRWFVRRYLEANSGRVRRFTSG